MLATDTENITAVIVCREGSFEFLGDGFCSELVVGQLTRVIFEMQFQAAIEDNLPEEPEWLTDRIQEEMNAYAAGEQVGH